MKLTRRQLRKLINEAMMGPRVPIKYYGIKTGRDGIPGIAAPMQPVILKTDLQNGKYTIVKVPGIETRETGMPASHSSSASFDPDRIGQAINMARSTIDQRKLKFQLLKFLGPLKSVGRFSVTEYGGGDTYQKVLQMNNILNTGEGEIELSEDQYKSILQASGDPNLAQGMEDFRRETAPQQMQQLDMAAPSYDPETGAALQESFSRGSLLRRRYRRKY
tara:strand:- start:341 stop:997 length:657 start_codon:yes stop_codon:yes gene_type:complete